MQRPLQISFRNLERSEYLESLIRERVHRLEKFHPHLTGCRVVVEVPHRSPDGVKPPIGISVEVELPGRPLVVARDVEERRDAKGDHVVVINRAFDAAQRQLEDTTEIQGGEVKLHEDARETGCVVRLFPEQNYGFIEVRGAPELYFTRNAVADGRFDDLRVGMMVGITRATGEGPMGPQASSVRVLGGERRG